MLSDYLKTAANFTCLQLSSHSINYVTFVFAQLDQASLPQLLYVRGQKNILINLQC